MKSKQLLLLLLSFILVFSLCACQSEESFLYMNLPDDEPNWIPGSVVESDEYLRANGYSEEFIESTGKQTKLQLHYWGGVDALPLQFEAQSETVDSMVIDGLTCGVTVSDMSPTELLKVKVVTFNWEWDSEQLAADDTISITWKPSEITHDNDYGVYFNGSVFELFGTGSLIEGSAAPEDFNAPESKYGTFYCESAALSQGMSGYGSITQTLVENNTLSHTINVDGVFINEQYFSEEEGGGKAEYLMDTHCYKGSYTIVLIRVLNTFDVEQKVNHVVTATYKHGGSEQSVFCMLTDF